MLIMIDGDLWCQLSAVDRDGDLNWVHVEGFRRQPRRGAPPMLPISSLSTLRLHSHTILRQLCVEAYVSSFLRPVLNITRDFLSREINIEARCHPQLLQVRPSVRQSVSQAVSQERGWPCTGGANAFARAHTHERERERDREERER
jgi:hypothetical protein